MDSILIVRLWRSTKYEAIYLPDLTDGFRAQQVIGDWFNFYNTERPIRSLVAKRRPKPRTIRGCVEVVGEPLWI